MKILIAVIVAALVLAACYHQPSSTRHTDNQATVQGAVIGHHYHCESDNLIMVSNPSADSATVAYRDMQYTMRIAVSASGVRYVDDNYEWWVKGSGSGAKGTLFRHLKDGTTGNAIETCTAL